MAIYGNIENVDAVLLATVTAEVIHVKGADGVDGITPTIGANGNWYLGDIDTGKPSRGERGKDGHTPVKGTDYWTASDKAEVVAEASAAVDLTSYAKKTEIPTKTSQLTNDSGFGTYSKPAGGIPESDLSFDVKTKLNSRDTNIITIDTENADPLNPYKSSKTLEAIKNDFTHNIEQFVFYDNISYKLEKIIIDNGVEKAVFYSTSRLVTNVLTYYTCEIYEGNFGYSTAGFHTYTVNNVSAVESVNGKKGDVVLNAEDVGAQRPLIAGSGISIVWREDGDIIQSDASGGGGLVSFVEEDGGVPIAQFTLNQTEDCEINVNTLTARLGTKVNNLEVSISGKQDKLIAGEGITIAADGKTISSSGKVSSVNGKTGAVTLNAEDIIYAKESQKLDATIAGLKAADAQMASDISELQTADASLDSRITAIETGDTPVTLYIYWESVVSGGRVSLTKDGAAMSVTDFISKMQSGAKIIIGENSDTDSESSGFSNYRYKITDSTAASLAFDVANSFNGSNRTIIISGSSSTNGLMTGYQDIGHDDLSDYSPLPEGSTPASKAWVENYVAEAAAAIDLTSYAKKTEVPTKTSQLTNDSGFLTSHQDISGKQDKSTLEADVAAKGFTKNTGTYSKPDGGIPKADLAAAVQTSLGKADTALQEHQSLAAYRTAAAQDVIDSGKVDKVTGKGLSSNDYTDAAKAKVDAIPAVDTTLTVSGAAADANETGTRLNTLSGKIDNFIASGGFSAPIVDSVDEMVDTNKQYILKSTGTIWSYKSSTSEQEVTVTDTITATNDNPYKDNTRLGSSGDAFNTQNGYHVTPLIDLTKTKYAGKTIQIHLEGAKYASAETYANYIQCRPYKKDGVTVLAARAYVCEGADVSSSIHTTFQNVSVDYISETSSVLTVHMPPLFGFGTPQEIGYIRFCGHGAVADSHIYITYIDTQTVTSEQWVDTGIQYGSGGLDAETAAKISALNNEGNSPSTIKLLPKPVLDFYNSAAYSDSDYSYSHLEKITYPCRADIPVPYTVKWNYNESAMRTTVAVDTRAIGTVNAYTLRTYDATGLNKFPIYNLLPNKTYYYKVTHVMADGSLVEAKSGNFTTSSEAWRLLYIDGTQNVRDLGGWTGLNGKKVKYGKIIRGAALSDSSHPELLLTGTGWRSLGELAIQAELNLGAIDSETSIAANCVYKKLYYTNYAIAITDATYRAKFKEVLEWIVEQLTASKPIYMHCQGGCDRTGTLAFQLLGLLGVSESDLAKEYELSSFSSIGFGRLRTTTQAVNTYDYVGMVEALKTYSGSTVTEKFYNFATTGCSISADTITNFRNLMLE